MKYEFHVGDYVETKDGYTGYVKSFRTYYDYDLKVDAVDLVCIEERDGKNRKESLWVTSDTIPKRFNRIGQYDFVPRKIEKVDIDDDIWNSLSLCASKINELVDAVNELRKASHAE